MSKEARAASIRVYNELRSRGHSDRHAFRAAATALHYRSPDMGPANATITAAEWISDHLEAGSV